MTTLNQDFDRRFDDAKAAAADAAEQGFSALNKSLRAAIDLQAAEIERLRGIIEDGTTIPQRHALAGHLSSYTTGGRERRDVLAFGSDHNMWLLIDAPIHPSGVKYHPGWIRLPPLPQARDEMDAAPARQEGSDGE
jgi:hypothetical protein